MTLMGDGFRDRATPVRSIRGTRAWIFRYPGNSVYFREQSMSTDTSLIGQWHGSWNLDGINKAECRQSLRYRIPRCSGIGVDCDCGFYAYYTSDINDLEMHLPVSVVGVVEGFGKITVGEKGFRCEKAKILAICLLGAGDLNTVGIGWRNRTATQGYSWRSIKLPEFDMFTRHSRVPVFPSWEQMVAEYPPSRPEDIL